ncbi:Serpin_1 [Hexamita inflata]|uniref:Serpin 1 n=1 Tax=Hexamita inflata TaxID=28002 RepID=A0AA86NV96_9EUKA|nr:Serpin 1 [Hexamita inflata]
MQTINETSSILNNHTQDIAKIIDFTSNSTCYSPFSLLHVLSILTKCANYNDDAIIELVTQLKLNFTLILSIFRQISSESSIQLASNVFISDIASISPDFEQFMKRLFNTAPEKLNSVDQVNKWCAKQTNGKIAEIVDSIMGVEALLVSAIHFKAAWAYEFDPKRTMTKQFNSFTSHSSVQMMQMTRRLDYAQTPSAQIIRLPYKDSTLSALIILPNSTSKSDFVSSLCVSNLQPVYTTSNVNFELPKFKISSTINLVGTLKRLHVSHIFNKVNCSENLQKELKISEIIQKTEIETNERGTEAATVSVVKMMKGASREEAKRVICDRPFYFAVCGQQGVIFVTSVVE